MISEYKSFFNDKEQEFLSFVGVMSKMELLQYLNEDTLLQTVK